MKIKSLFSSIPYIVFMLCFSPPASTEEPKAVVHDSTVLSTGSTLNLGVSLGLDIMQGYTQYQRGGSYVLANGSAGAVHFPISELKFPLDVYMGSLQLDAKWQNIFFSVSYKQNLNKNAGKMQDSDWGYWYLMGTPTSGTFTQTPAPDTLDIFSKSDTDLEAQIWDISVGYVIIEKPAWCLKGMLGSLHQNFDYDARNLEQWYPSIPYYTDYAYHLNSSSVSGDVIKYEITYKIPYAKLAFEGSLTSKIKVGVNAGYTPYVKADDQDDHLLRDLVGKGTYTGRASMYGLQCTGQISPCLSLGITYDFMRITTRGECDDYEGGLYYEVIDQNSKSEQHATALKLRYSFY